MVDAIKDSRITMYRSRHNGAISLRDADFELIAESIPQIVFIAATPAASLRTRSRSSDTWRCAPARLRPGG
jgi:hypothetical protein